MTDSPASTASSATTSRSTEPPLRSAQQRPGKPAERIAVIVLSVLLLAAVVLRLEPVLFYPSIAWPDEIFQATEQAHRLVYGTGLVPWEFRLGMRSWLLPGVIAGLMEFARLFGDGPDYYLPVIAIAFASLAAAPVLCCFLWCRRWFGLSESLLAAGVVATAPELVFYGARTLSEVVAAHILVIALFLLTPGSRGIGRGRLFTAGFLLGLSLYVRVQLAPAVAVAVLWGDPRALRQRLPALLAGAGTLLALAGMFDWATLGYPFASIWRNVKFNLLFEVSALWGVKAWYFYPKDFLGLWTATILPLVILVLCGAPRLKLPLALAATIVVSHSLIPHKEYRFIYPAIVLLMTIVGVGLAQLATWGWRSLAARGLPAGRAHLTATVLALGLWGLMALNVWGGPAMAQLRSRDHDPLLAAEFVAHLAKPACGIGLYASRGVPVWPHLGGYTYFHRAVPIYWPVGPARLAATMPGFDVLIYTKKPPPASFGFVVQRCFGTVCVARRSGGCTPVTPTPMPAPPAGLPEAGR